MPIWRLCFFSTGTVAVPSEASAREEKKNAATTSIHGALVTTWSLSRGGEEVKSLCLQPNALWWCRASDSSIGWPYLTFWGEQSSLKQRGITSFWKILSWLNKKKNSRRANVCVGHFFVCPLSLVQKLEERKQNQVKKDWSETKARGARCSHRSNLTICVCCLTEKGAEGCQTLPSDSIQKHARHRAPVLEYLTYFTVCVWAENILHLKVLIITQQ